jgi:WD40 repeat protein/serine/threonine protein kinase/class 3 adenylate cyclase
MQPGFIIAPPHSDPASHHPSPRTGVVTILFTDICDSTALKQTLGDRASAAIFGRHHRLVRQILALFPGALEIETAGDSFLLTFEGPSDAVKFALILQNRMTDLARECKAPLMDRIGIHLGEVLVESGVMARKPRDLYGIQIDTCARAMSLARPGQILTTRFVFDSARQVLKREDIPGVGELEWFNHGLYRFKGLEESSEICEVREAGRNTGGAPVDSEKARRDVVPGDEQVLGWRPAVGEAVPHAKFIIERKLGEGGFGEVWLGRHSVTKERRVFKFCFEVSRARFLKRELTLFRLLKERLGEHPNIVRVHDFFLEEAPYFVELDYIDGMDVRKWCDGHGGAQNIPLDTRLEIVAQAADGLQAAHDAGVIHRDIKPGNILIGGKNGTDALRVKLADFGIGQVVSENALSGITQIGFTVTILPENSGTHLYMAPEVIAGKGASIRSDLYSLGVVLYQLIVGDFNRPVTTDWEKSVSDPLLIADLEQCFAGNPSERFAGAAQLAKNLRQLPTRRQERQRQEAELKAKQAAAYRRGVLKTAGLSLIGFLMLGYLIYRSEVAIAAKAVAIRDLERDRIETLLERGRTPEALALIGRRLRSNPEDQALARRSVALLTYRWFPQPAAKEFHHPGLSSPTRGSIAAALSGSGRFVVTGSKQGTAQLWSVERGEAMGPPLTHPGPVDLVGFSPDSRRFFTVCGDLGVRIWDVETAQIVGPPFMHSSEALCASFSPDGRLIAAGGRDGVVEVFDTQSGSSRFHLRHKGAVRAVIFSPDGRTIATASEDSTARIWNAETGAPLTEPLLHNTQVHCAAFSPDGLWLGTGSLEFAQIWNVKTGSPVGPPMRHGDMVRSIAFDLTGKRIVTASEDRTARIWNVSNGTAITPPLKHDYPIWSARFSPDGTKVLTASYDQTARLWDAASGAALSEPMRHDGNVKVAQFDAAGLLLMTAGTDDIARVYRAVWTAAIPDMLTQGGKLSTAQFSPDGKLALTASYEDGMARIWDVSTLKVLWTLAHKGPINRAVFSPDGKKVATASSDKTARLWSVETGKPIGPPLVHEDVVRSVQFSPDGMLLLTASNDSTARLWKTATGEPAFTPVRHRTEPIPERGANTAWVRGAAFSPDGANYVSFGYDGTARVWETKTSRQLFESIQYHDVVRSAEFSPDGRRLAISGDDYTADIRDARSGKRIAGPLKHFGIVWIARFSPDGRKLLTGSNDNTARLWDATTGDLLFEPLQHDAPVKTVAFSPSGALIATASLDGRLRIWDTMTGRPITDFLRSDGEISDLAFSRDDRRVIVAGWGAATIWDILAIGGDAPAWLPDLAEALAGYRFDAAGKMQLLLPHNFLDAKNRINVSANDGYSQWARWFFDARPERLISPYSSSTAVTFANLALEAGTTNTLSTALRLRPNDPRLVQAQARLVK